MSPALVNFLFEVANFVLLAGALSWLTFKPIRAALVAEQKRRDDDEARLAQARTEADAWSRTSADAHRQLDEELAKRRTELLAEARKEVAELHEAAREQQLAATQAMQLRQQAAEHAQAEALVDTVGRLAAASVRRFLDALSGPALDTALVSAACGELVTLPAEAKTACIVESARPLDDASRRLLDEAIGHRYVERTVPELGAGIRVTTTAGQVDGSAINLAREAAVRVTARIRAAE